MEKAAYYVTYRVGGFPGERAAGPYRWCELQSQKSDIEGYGSVYDVVIKHIDQIEAEKKLKVQELQIKKLKTQELLIKLSDAVSFVYRDDNISPGVVVSTLKDKQVYASVVRYNNSWSNKKKVVCNVKGDSLETAIGRLSDKFIDHVTRMGHDAQNPLDVLKSSR